MFSRRIAAENINKFNSKESEMTAKEKLGVCMSMPLNAGIRRFVLTGAIAVVSMAWAMPTKEEIKRVQPLVNELMSEHVDAYKGVPRTVSTSNSSRGTSPETL